MIKKEPGISLLKRNFDRVEEKFLDFFEHRAARWPMEKHDFLRNHHKSLDNFFVANISLEKLKLVDLPEPILHEVQAAYEAFQRGEEYN
ncbi:MAG TPA: hypothetical protein VGM30_20615 [Puia sp.]|jgi:hypothetical protein